MLCMQKNLDRLARSGYMLLFYLLLFSLFVHIDQNIQILKVSYIYYVNTFSEEILDESPIT
jgi:hypothetical protein